MFNNNISYDYVDIVIWFTLPKINDFLRRIYIPLKQFEYFSIGKFESYLSMQIFIVKLLNFYANFTDSMHFSTVFLYDPWYVSVLLVYEHLGIFQFFMRLMFPVFTCKLLNLHMFKAQIILDCCYPSDLYRLCKNTPITRDFECGRPSKLG